jgi:hypothetical protein
VPALAVAANEQHLVLNAAPLVAARVQELNKGFEALPLCLFSVRIKALVGRVCPVDQAKVDGSLRVG